MLNERPVLESERLGLNDQLGSKAEFKLTHYQLA